jgi:hypothetical protein
VITHVRRVTVAAATLAALALALAGCGSERSSRHPSVSRIPLAPGTRVIAHARRCDVGADSYCAVQLVVAGAPGRYRDSGALLTGETRHLSRSGWGETSGDTIHERAAESPHNKLRVTYATASEDLTSIDEGTITRQDSIARSLSRQMFARAPALSLMLQSGAS